MTLMTGQKLLKTLLQNEKVLVTNISSLSHDVSFPFKFKSLSFHSQFVNFKCSKFQTSLQFCCLVERGFMLLNSLPKDKILDLSKLIGFAEGKLNMGEKLKNLNLFWKV